MDAQWQYTPLAMPLGISTALILALIVLGLRQRKNPLATPFLFFMVCLLIWIVASIVEILTLNLRLSLLAADISFLGITFFSVAWLGIVMIYIGKGKLFRRLLPWIVIVPFLTNIVIWTNPLHHFWRGDSYRDLTLTWFPVSIYDYGPWFYIVHLPFALTIALVAIVLLLRSPYLNDRVYRTQIIAMLTALILPLVTALLHEVGIQPIPHYNASSLVFPISGLLIGWSLLDFRLLDVTPIARDIVLENMQDIMVVVDSQQRIIDVNPAAKNRLLMDSSGAVGKNITSLLPELNELLLQTEGENFQDELKIYRDNTYKIYDVRVSSITRPKGQIFLFHDITSRKQTEQALFEQAHQVAILEERQRVARELHDSVNQSLFAAGTLADLLPRAIDRKPEKVPEYARSIQQLIQGANAEMRLILLELYPDALAETDLDIILQHLCLAFTGIMGTVVDFSTTTQVHLQKNMQITFYRIAEEALHNINKHTEATQVSVQLARIEGTVELIIQDNGDGFDTESIPHGHFGLKNMYDRAADVGATLSIVSHIDKGTTVRLVGVTS